MSEKEDILLQRFAVTGDAEAFSQIVQHHAPLVYGSCIRILGDRDRAADAAQETFFQLLKNASDITGSVTGWLHKVATNKAYDIVRRESSLRQREAKYSADRPVKADKWEDISPHVDKAMDELDQEYREIMMDYFLKGLSMKDIGESAGISQPTVSRRIDSGLAQLRKKLQKRGVIVALIGLGTFLSENAAQAAPAILMKELGKMAIVGATSATGVAVSATGAAAKTTAGMAMTGLKAKVITVAVVAAVGAGVVTYKQATKPSESPGPVSTLRGQGLENVGRRQQLTNRSRQADASSEYNSEIITDDTSREDLTDAQIDEAIAELMDEGTRPQTRPAASTRRRSATSSDPNDDSQEEAGGGMMGGGMGIGGGMGGGMGGGGGGYIMGEEGG